MDDARHPWLPWSAAAIVLVLVSGAATALLLRDTGPEGSDACGPLVGKDDGGVWQCTFHDDFDRTRLDPGRWTVLESPPSGQTGARACPTDDPRTIELADGELRLSVIEADEPLTCQGQPAAHASGQVGTHELFAQQYGRFEARIKVTAADEPGLQEAFWLWPADPPDPGDPVWPAAGEIDIAETYSSDPAYAVPFLHYTANDNGGPIAGRNTAHCDADRGGWHTYTLEWTETELRMLVDGEECLVNTDDDPAFDKPYFIVLSAMLGRGRNAYDGAAPLPATTSVDYVRVWR